MKLLFLEPIFAAQFLLAQATCGNVQLQLTPDYGFAIGSSSGGGAYTLSAALRAKIDETVFLVVITEQSEKRNQS